MTLIRFINKLLVVGLILVFSLNPCYSDELIAGFEEDDVPVLNEELRKRAEDIRTNAEDIDTNTTDIATNTAAIAALPSGGSIQAWASITYAAGTPTLNDSYNVDTVTGITDVADGIVTIPWDTNFASVNYVVVATAKDATTNSRTAMVQAIAVGSVTIRVENQAGGDRDPDGLYVMAIGDQ